MFGLRERFSRKNERNFVEGIKEIPKIERQIPAGGIMRHDIFSCSSASFRRRPGHLSSILKARYSFADVANVIRDRGLQRRERE